MHYLIKMYYLYLPKTYKLVRQCVISVFFRTTIVVCSRYGLCMDAINDISIVRALPYMRNFDNTTLY